MIRRLGKYRFGDGRQNSGGFRGKAEDRVLVSSSRVVGFVVSLSLCFVRRVEKSTCAEVENARDELAEDALYHIRRVLQKGVATLTRSHFVQKSTQDLLAE